MATFRPPCPPESRRPMVEPVRSVKIPEGVSGEFEQTARSIHNLMTGSGRDGRGWCGKRGSANG